MIDYADSTYHVAFAITACAVGLLSFHSGLVLAVATFFLWIARIGLAVGAVLPLALIATGDGGSDMTFSAMISVASSIALIQLSLIASLVTRSRRESKPTTVRRKRKSLITDVEGDRGSP